MRYPISAVVNLVNDDRELREHAPLPLHVHDETRCARDVELLLALLRAAPERTTFELNVAASGAVVATCTRFGGKVVRAAKPRGRDERRPRERHRGPATKPSF